MGLDCSHDAFHGAYSAFNRLRQEVCRAAGGSFPPHWKRNPDGTRVEKDGNPVRDPSLDDGSWYIGDEYTSESSPGLFEFLNHSDCDGEISPEMCKLVADELEDIMPKFKESLPPSGGHIALQGGYVNVLRKFIEGCRAAYAAGEPLIFS